MSSKIVKTLRPYPKTPLKPLYLLAFLVLKALKTLLRPLRLLQNCYKIVTKLLQNFKVCIAFIMQVSGKSTLFLKL